MRLKFIAVCIIIFAVAVTLRASLLNKSWTVAVVYDLPESASLAFDISESVTDESQLVFPLNLNTATEKDLMQLPRIGEVLASRIVQYRDVLGEYTDLTQLTQIKGISDNMLEQLSPFLYIVEEDT